MILIAESHKLDPGPLDEGSKTEEWQIEAKPTWHHFGGEINCFGPQRKELQGELMIWRTKMQARVQGRVQLKDSVCFK